MNMGEPHELKLKPRQLRPHSGGHKGHHNDGGSGKKKAELPRGFREAAQSATTDNKMMLVLDGPNLKRRFVRVRDFK